MKKVLGAIVVAGAVAGVNVFACGGMQALDPPNISDPTGEADDYDSMLEDLEGALVIC